MDKGEIMFHISIMAMLIVIVAIFGYKMVFLSEAYLRILGI
ncbi:MAG: hypothetical protein ACD_15C00195G0011 [uncultured bacterium]|nr:MAG: hypothetical protein ACD_15C00195G0011 [uncultured bacterium]